MSVHDRHRFIKIVSRVRQHIADRSNLVIFARADAILWRFSC
jgi:hypothetical protein